MDPAEVYKSAYDAGAGRHATRSALSAIQTSMGVAAPTPNLTPGEAAEKVVYDIFINMLHYLLAAFFLWIVYDAVHWRRWAFDIGEWLEGADIHPWQLIITSVRALIMLPLLIIHLTILLLQFAVHAIAQNARVRFIDQATREGVIRAKNLCERSYDNFRYNSLNDAIYLQYQLCFNWVGNHKLQLIVCFVIIWFTSTFIDNNKNTLRDVFMEWTELQRYLDQPLPEILFWKPKEFGSNSHYHRL